MFSGAYSAALRKRFWLPTIPIANGVQVAPHDTFPVQQKLVLDQTYGSQDCIYVHLGDALLKPERFAAGFLIYIQSLLASADNCTVQPMNLFSFFSARRSFLDGDPVTAAEIGPVLAENLAAPKHISLHTNNNPFRRC